MKAARVLRCADGQLIKCGLPYKIPYQPNTLDETHVLFYFLKHFCPFIRSILDELSSHMRCNANTMYTIWLKHWLEEGGCGEIHAHLRRENLKNQKCWMRLLTQSYFHFIHLARRMRWWNDKHTIPMIRLLTALLWWHRSNKKHIYIFKLYTIRAPFAPAHIPHSTININLYWEHFFAHSTHSLSISSHYW